MKGVLRKKEKDSDSRKPKEGPNTKRVAIRPERRKGKEDDDDEEDEIDEDFIPESRDYGASLIRSGLPLRFLSYLAGLFPFRVKNNKDGTYTYTFTWFFPNGIHFILVTVLVLFIVLYGSMSLFMIMIRDTHGSSNSSNSSNVTQGNDTQIPFDDLGIERVLIYRHVVTFIVLWTNLTHCAIVSCNVFLKRKFIADYLSNWTVVMNHMQIVTPVSVFFNSVGYVVAYFVLVSTIVLLSHFRIGPSLTGGPFILSMLASHGMISPERLNDEDIHHTFRLVGVVLSSMIFTAAKVYIFMFVHTCKLLQNAFAHWNARVFHCFIKGTEYTQTEEGRTTYQLLFKDHCMLLDLMEGCDRMFSTILESFFSLQSCSICFEMYFFLRTVKFGNDQYGATGPLASPSFFIRPNDYIPGFLILIQNLLLIWFVSQAAAAVGEEAMAGLEVLRRKTMLGRKTDEELYFMLSMFSSYTAYKRMELTGGGYFRINKDFIVGVFSTTLSYFIILYQFQPVLDYQLKPELRPQVGKFLENLEHLPGKHWMAPEEVIAIQNKQTI